MNIAYLMAARTTATVEKLKCILKMVGMIERSEGMWV
jgi:hypothetical protein